MTIRRHVLAATALSALSTALPMAALAQERLPVVASFSILGDLVSEVGGDRVEVTTLVGPDGDAHAYQPSPADAQAVASASLVVVNGLGFEGWIDRLVEASEYQGPVVTATEGIEPLVLAEGEEHAEGEEEHAEGEEHVEEEHAAEETGHDHGGTDPHAWQSLANARVYVANIEAGLTAADPEGADTYAANADAYLAEIDALEAEVLTAVAALPEDRRTVVTSHDAFGYYADAYGLDFLAPQGMNTDSEASAADVAALITQVADGGVTAVFVENITDPRLIEQIASETGATVGGTLYSDALSGEGDPAATYLDMMRHNTATLTGALGGA